MIYAGIYIKKLLFVTTLVVFYGFSICTAQHPFYHTITDEEGLPSSEVYQIIQDKKGYMWIGCDAGLYRYNGFEFKAHKNSKQNSRSISNLAFDAEGKLWCRNFSGQLFNIINDSLHLIADYSKDANRYQITFYDKPGFWLINSREIQLNDKSGKTIKRFPIDLNGKKISSGVEMIYFEDQLWIEIPGLGLHYLNTQNGKMELVFPTNLNMSYQAQQFFIYKKKLFLLRSENMPSEDNYIYEINTETKTAKQIYYFYNPTHIRNYSFFEDSSHKLWIGSSVGAICIPDVYRFTQPETIYLLRHKISSIYQDNEGNYWFTDLQDGLHFIPDMKSIITNFDNPSILENDFTSIKELSNNKIAIGTYSGNFYLFDPSSKEFVSQKNINKNKGFTVKDIEEYKNNVFIARGGFYKFNSKNDKLISSKHLGNSRDITIMNDSIYSIQPEQVVKICITDLNNNNITPQNILPIGGRKIEKDPLTNEIYMALNNGLFVYKKNNLKELKIKSESIYALSITSDNNSVWIGTHSQGLIQIKKGQIIEQHINKGELDDRSIKNICANNRFVWGVTNSDVFRFDKISKQLYTYSKNIGIIPREVNCITIGGDKIYFGSKKNLITIPIDQDQALNYKPKIEIESITQNNIKIDQKNELTLPYDFTNLEIKFISFSYKSRKHFKYEYRLIGLDSAWYKISFDKNSITFSSLPPGKYLFEVKSITENGVSSDIERINFTVNSPLWQKGWFYILVTLLSITIVILFFSIQIKKIRKRNAIEKKLIQSQLTALKAQMNPHFMYNALNSIQALILKQDIKNSNLYLGKFSHLMRKVLEISEKEEITLQEEKTVLELYLSLEKLRFGNEFNYTISINKNVDEFSICMPPMIIQPYVENAIKHGLLHKKGEKKLIIDFSIDNELICTITDNGIGRKHAKEIKERQSEKHQSFASKATEKRVELLNHINRENYKIEIIDMENNHSNGTIVIIRIPLK